MRTDTLRDFCNAVLADNRPRVGVQWDIIAAAINRGRVRAYKIGFEDGSRASAAQPPNSPNQQGVTE